MRKSIIAVLAAVLVLASLCSCTVLSSTKRESEAVLTVGEHSVPYELYYYISENVKKDLPEADRQTVDGETYQILREMYAAFELAEDLGIAFDDEYIASAVDDAVSLAIEECGSKAKYKDALSENCMNDSVFRFLEKHSRTADEALAALIDSGKYPTDLDGVRSLVLSDEFVCVKQILVKSENSKSSYDDTYINAGEKKTDEEALAIAEKARDKALAGEDFDSLVNEYGESLYMFNNTDGYYVCRGMWDGVNEDAVFALEMGEVSEVIESESGYSVFLRCEKSESFIEKNASSLATDYHKAQYNLMLEKTAEELEVKPLEALESIRAEEK
ncbi:MAG: peptidylprolyl isomerase [Clostridia bacterium]|nr:peptidylprolyl isomerase [Clostridia bacterium]